MFSIVFTFTTRGLFSRILYRWRHPFNMSFVMQLHQPLREEALATDFADPVLYAILLVHLLVVSLEIAIRSQFCLTDLTLKRSLSCVGDLMFSHNTHTWESFWTMGTLNFFKGSLFLTVQVSLLVVMQTPSTGIAFTTYLTHKSR